MLKIGVTGGIGSGKTTICKIFETLGVPVYNADIAARQIMLNDTEVQQQLIHTFGSNTYMPDGNINRVYLSGIVFNNQEQLSRLNAIVHPAVGRHFEHWCVQQTNKLYIIKEAAIMFESGSHKSLDKIVMVYAPLDIRLQRAAQRDNTTTENIQKRINNQMTDEEKLQLSDYVIYNDNQHAVIPQVMTLHRTFTETKNKK